MLYSKKLGFTGVRDRVPIFLISDPTHRLWVLVAVLTCTQIQCFDQNIKNIKPFPTTFSNLTAEYHCRIEGICHDAILLHYGNMPTCTQYTAKLKAAELTHLMKQNYIFINLFKTLIVVRRYSHYAIERRF